MVLLIFNFFSLVAYGTSKIGVTALSKIQARALSQDPREDILLNAVSQKLENINRRGFKNYIPRLIS